MADDSLLNLNRRGIHHERFSGRALGDLPADNDPAQLLQTADSFEAFFEDPAIRPHDLDRGEAYQFLFLGVTAVVPRSFAFVVGSFIASLEDGGIRKREDRAAVDEWFVISHDAATDGDFVAGFGGAADEMDFLGGSLRGIGQNPLESFARR